MLPPTSSQQVAALASAVLTACCCWLVLVAAQPAQAWDVHGDEAVCCGIGPAPNDPYGLLCDPDLSGWVPFDYPEYPDNIVDTCRMKGHEAQFNAVCRSVPYIGGDPHVTGFDGSNYLLWGKPNATYDLISEHSHQINIRLYHPPSLPEDAALFIEAVGIMIHHARITVHIDQQGGPTAAASMVLTVHSAINDSRAPETFAWTGHTFRGSTADIGTFCTFKTQAQIVITSRDITLSVFLRGDHLDISVDKVASYWGDVHGVMGQTHSAAFRPMEHSRTPAAGKGGTAAGAGLPDRAPADARVDKKELVLQGSEIDYITSGLLLADDKFSRFAVAGGAAAAPHAVTRKLLMVDKAGGFTGSHQVLDTSAGVASGGQAAGLLVEQRRRSLLSAISDSMWVCEDLPPNYY